mgnify:CR=1 FL=1
MKQITYQPAALKALRKMPANTAKRIVSKVEAYAENPASQANNVKALKGVDAMRLRVGDWRVVMVEGAVIDVIKIAPRGSVY